MKKILFLIVFIACQSSVFAQYKSVLDLSRSVITDYKKFTLLYLSPSDISIQYDDFSVGSTGSATIGQLKWFRASIGTPSGSTQGYGVDNSEPDGYFFISSGTAANAGQYIATQFCYTDSIEAVFRIRVSSLDSVTYIIGFSDDLSTIGVDHGTYSLEFVYDYATSPNWIVVTENNSGRNQFTTTIPATTNWTNFRIQTENNSARFYINGVLVKEFSTFLPGNAFGQKPLIRVVQKELDLPTNKFIYIGHFIKIDYNKKPQF